MNKRSHHVSYLTGKSLLPDFIIWRSFCCTLWLWHVRRKGIFTDWAGGARAKAGSSPTISTYRDAGFTLVSAFNFRSPGTCNVDWQSPVGLAQQPRRLLQPLRSCQPTPMLGTGWVTTSNVQCVLMASYRCFFPALYRIRSCYVPATLRDDDGWLLCRNWSSEDWTHCLRRFLISLDFAMVVSDP